MVDKPRYLLGRGERLTQQWDRSGGGGGKPRYPYSLARAKARLSPMLGRMVEQMQALDPRCCPGGQAVAVVTMHPQFIAKSRYPQHLFKRYGLRPVGSMPLEVEPERYSNQKLSGPMPTHAWLLAGRRDAFARWASEISGLGDEIPRTAAVGRDLQTLEEIHVHQVEERLGEMPAPSDSAVRMELVVHASGRDDQLLSSLAEWLRAQNLSTEDVAPQTAKRFFLRGLTFWRVRATRAQAEKIAQFSFVRALRVMASIRPLPEPAIRSAEETIELPQEPPLNPQATVAVFDGGLPPDHGLERWVKSYEPVNPAKIGAPVAEYTRHGMGVTSALLFGHVPDNNVLPQPFCRVSHHRVLGDAQRDIDLFEVVDEIRLVMTARHYEFVSLSVGPPKPIDDGNPSLWTALIDELLEEGGTLMGIAVGNDGHRPEPRIQVPADAANALAVGATACRTELWSRAIYSCVGPGRAPAGIKPDVVAFGGSTRHPFVTVGPGGVLMTTQGTSFSTPSVIRLGTGVQAVLGDALSSEAIRALILTSAHQNGHPASEVGWGRVPDTVDDLVTCPDGVVRVVFQGTLHRGQVTEFQIPLPDGLVEGNLWIDAAFCYVCRADANTPSDYTRAGLTVRFRPNARDVDKKSGRAKTGAFFTGEGPQHEQDLRRLGYKWSTVLSRRRQFSADQLVRPTFEVEYSTRAPGEQRDPLADNEPGLHYALVLTITADREADLYDKVLSEYRVLQPIEPVIELPGTSIAT